MASTNCWTKERFNLLHLTPFTSSSFSLCSFVCPFHLTATSSYCSRLPVSSASISTEVVVTSCCYDSMRDFFIFFLDCLYTQWNPFCTLRQPVSHCMHFTSSLCAKVYCTNGQKKTCSRYIWIWKIISCSNQSFYVWLHVCVYEKMAACACMGSA